MIVWYSATVDLLEPEFGRCYSSANKNEHFLKICTDVLHKCTTRGFGVQVKNKQRKESKQSKQKGRGTSSKKDLSKNHILDSALMVIGRQGMEALTHRSVAAQAGVSNSTVAYYFRTKHDLALNSFRKLLSDNNNIFSEDIATLIEEGRPPSVSEFLAVAVGISEREFKSGYLMQAEHELILYSRHDEDIKNAYRRWADAQRRDLQVALDEEGYVNADAALINDMWVGFEQRALTAKNVKFSDLLGQVQSLLNLFEKKTAKKK